MTDPSDDPYGGDVLLRDCVERALAPHEGRLSAAQLTAIRDYLIVFMTSHPAAEALYARLRRRPAVVRSTLVERMRERDAAGTAPRIGGTRSGKARGT